MIKQRIRDGFITMDMKEFNDLQRLLNMDSKIRHLTMSQSNFDFYERKKSRDN